MDSVLLLLLKYKYLILFPLAAFEGPLVSVVVGFLVFSNTLSLWPSYVILLFGDIIPDTAYYYLGYYGGDRGFVKKRISSSKFFSEHFDLVKKLWDSHPAKTMFFSKIAYGMATPFLISAGMVKMPFKKFISYTIPITVFQYSILLFVGYHLGNSYTHAVAYAKNAYLIVGLGLLVIVVAYIFVIKYARKKISAMEKIDDK